MYNKIVPSAEAKEPSEVRQHLNRAGDAAQDAGRDVKTSAYELKEAVTDGARSYGRAAQDRCAYQACLPVAFRCSNLQPLAVSLCYRVYTSKRAL